MGRTLYARKASSRSEDRQPRRGRRWPGRVGLIACRGPGSRANATAETGASPIRVSGRDATVPRIRLETTKRRLLTAGGSGKRIYAIDLPGAGKRECAHGPPSATWPKQRASRRLLSRAISTSVSICPRGQCNGSRARSVDLTTVRTLTRSVY